MDRQPARGQCDGSNKIFQARGGKVQIRPVLGFKAVLLASNHEQCGGGEVSSPDGSLPDALSAFIKSSRGSFSRGHRPGRGQYRLSFGSGHVFERPWSSKRG